MLLNCEICVHQETRDRIPARFRRWTDYAEHMAQFHSLKVKKDGLHTESANPKPLPKSDEL